MHNQTAYKHVHLHPKPCKKKKREREKDIIEILHNLEFYE